MFNFFTRLMMIATKLNASRRDLIGAGGNTAFPTTID